MKKLLRMILLILKGGGLTVINLCKERLHKLKLKHIFPWQLLSLSSRLPFRLGTQIALLTSRHFMLVCATFLACQQVKNVKPNYQLDIHTSSSVLTCERKKSRGLRLCLHFGMYKIPSIFINCVGKVGAITEFSDDRLGYESSVSLIAKC